MPPKYRGGRGGGEGGGGRGGGGGQRGAPRGGRGGGRGGGPPGDSTQRTPSQAQPSRGGGPPRARNVSQPPTSPPGGASVPAGPWVQPSQFPALPSPSAQSPPSQTVRLPPPQAVQTIPAPQAPAQTTPQPTPRTRAAVESEDIVVFHFTLFIDVRIFLLVLAMAEKVDLSLCSRIISVYPIFQMSKCTNTLSLSPPRTGTPQQRALQPPSGKVLKSKQRLEKLTLV